MSSNVANLPDKWQQCLELYDNGAGDVEIAKKLGITLNYFRKLAGENPGFGAFVEKGTTLAMAYWYRIGREALYDKNFNYGLWAFNMKNRWGWADKVETSSIIDENVSADQLKIQLTQAIKRLAKKSPEILRDPELLAGDLTGDQSE